MLNTIVNPAGILQDLNRITRSGTLNGSNLQRLKQHFQEWLAFLDDDEQLGVVLEDWNTRFRPSLRRAQRPDSLSEVLEAILQRLRERRPPVNPIPWLLRALSQISRRISEVEQSREVALGTVRGTGSRLRSTTTATSQTLEQFASDRPGFSTRLAASAESSSRTENASTAIKAFLRGATGWFSTDGQDFQQTAENLARVHSRVTAVEQIAENLFQLHLEVTATGNNDDKIAFGLGILFGAGVSIEEQITSSLEDVEPRDIILLILGGPERFIGSVSLRRIWRELRQYYELAEMVWLFLNRPSPEISQLAEDAGREFAERRLQEIGAIANDTVVVPESLRSIRAVGNIAREYSQEFAYGRLWGPLILEFALSLIPTVGIARILRVGERLAEFIQRMAPRLGPRGQRAAQKLLDALQRDGQRTRGSPERQTDSEPPVDLQRNPPLDQPDVSPRSGSGGASPAPNEPPGPRVGGNVPGETESTGGLGRRRRRGRRAERGRVERGVPQEFLSAEEIQTSDALSRAGRRVTDLPKPEHWRALRERFGWNNAEIRELRRRIAQARRRDRLPSSSNPDHLVDGHLWDTKTMTRGTFSPSSMIRAIRNKAGIQARRFAYNVEGDQQSIREIARELNEYWRRQQRASGRGDFKQFEMRHGMFGSSVDEVVLINSSVASSIRFDVTVQALLAAF